MRAAAQDMDEQAYVDLQQIEKTHWWYRGIRTVCHLLLERYAGSSGPHTWDHGSPTESAYLYSKSAYLGSGSRGSLDDFYAEPGPFSRAVLEVGCGTGGNLDLLGRWGQVTGVDPWPPALHACPAGRAAFVQGVGNDLPFANQTFDLVALLNVLEHVEDDVTMLCEAARVCRPGGTVLLVVPAFMFLWSGHDRANHHWRRYTAQEVRDKAAQAGLITRYLSYQNCFLFPLVTVVRLLQWIGPPAPARIDMFPLPEPGSTLLTWLLILEGWLMRWITLPVGASLVAVLEPGTILC